MKALVGKKGWLSLDNDTNRTWDQYQGIFELEEDWHNKWTFELELRSSILRKMGVNYRFMIAPNKETIYREFVPNRFIRAPMTAADKLISDISSRSYFVPVESALKSSKALAPVYYRGDTHWNQFGSFIASNMFLKSIGVESIGMDECEFSIFQLSGDLIEKVFPGKTFAEIGGGPNKMAIEVYNNGVNNNGHIVIYENPARVGHGTVVLFGDSFAGNMSAWIASRVARLVRVHTPSVDMAIVKHERPRAVFSTIVERFLAHVPESIETFSIANDVREKIDEGHVLPTEWKDAPDAAFYNALR